MRNSAAVLLPALVLLSVDPSFGFHTDSFFGSKIRTSTSVTTRINVSPPPSHWATRSRRAASSLFLFGDGDDEVEGIDRFKSCIPYLLPFLDGDHFGQYIYARFPPLGMIDRALFGSVEQILQDVPWVSLVVFLALVFGSRNYNMSRSLRFNAQQAIILDICLIFPELVSSGFRGTSALPRYIMEPSSNFVYYVLMACIIYAVSSNLSGRKPNEIPIVSQAAEMAVGPF